ncbi:hypothetical protein HYE82_31335 [Streptomyces sp. BR123]|uniref:hypothetical protein n=1 Tax=Streptomyces sp. BR123 TaxID=2749828 RepID=UPI0015C4252F|nr:hypothetical protein [Streptomyces sp. BR123]NXY98795.1 hypothetical protein [Streptomyces sp. BR123]
MDTAQLSPTLPSSGQQPALRLVPGRRPTIDYVFDAPLAEMLAELNVEVAPSEIADAAVFGYAEVRGSRIVVKLSPNLSEFEADFFTRYLTAQAYRLEMTPLPTPFDVEISPQLEGVPA